MLALGALFLIFEGLRDRLEILPFFRDSLGGPGLRSHTHGSGNTLVPRSSGQLLSAQFADLHAARSRYLDGQTDNCRLLDWVDSKTAAANICLAA